MDADKLIHVLFKIKDKRSEMNAEYERQDKELGEKQDKIESALLELCKTNGVDSLSVVDNDYKFTVTRTVKERIWPADWSAFREFELEHPDYDFREKRVHQKNFRDFMEDNPEATPPVNIDRKYAVATRRTKK